MNRGAYDFLTSRLISRISRSRSETIREIEISGQGQAQKQLSVIEQESASPTEFSSPCCPADSRRSRKDRVWRSMRKWNRRALWRGLL